MCVSEWRKQEKPALNVVGIARRGAVTIDLLITHSCFPAAGDELSTETPCPSKLKRFPAAVFMVYECFRGRSNTDVSSSPTRFLPVQSQGLTCKDDVTLTCPPASGLV